MGDGRLGIVTRAVRQILNVLAVRRRSVDVVARIDRPDVAVLCKIGIRRAFASAAVGRRIKDLLAALEKIRACRAAFAVGDLVYIRAVDIHPIDAVARVAVAF